MKLSHRVLSMLLALVLLFGLFPTVWPTVVEAAASDTPAGVRNHLPSTAKDVVYLSDMNWEYSINYQNKEAIKNGAWSNGGAIVMGATTANGGTTFAKGLGVMPINTNSDPNTASRTIFDLADNNYKQNFFYAAAGITNRNADNATNGLVFEVWGSYDKSQDDYTKAEYTLLERSGDPAKNTHVTKGYVHQFHVDITGVRYLKLVVYAVGSISSTNANWAGVCVYNNPGYYPKSDLMGLNNGKDNDTWVPSGTDRFNTYHFNSLPADAVLLSGSTFKNTSDYKGTSKVVDFKSASGNLGSGSHWLGGIADSLTNTSTNQKDGILLKDATKYLRFNARQPASSSNQTDGWVTFDISDLDVNRFYAAIGGGNGNAKHTAYTPSNGTYGGMKVQVWGCATKDGTYTLLSESEPIMLSQTGEFLVDISGYNFLKIRFQAKDTRAINGLDTLVYMPCVFNAWDITASGATSVAQGDKADYTAKIRHDFDTDYNYSKAIAWAVEGALKSGTKIENGKLTVDPAETATELRITASITEGGKTITSKPVTVAVTKAPVYTLELQGPAEASKNSEHNLIATVTKDGAADSYSNIQWTLTGNTDAATKVENGKLTIGNEPVGTKLTIKASFTEYGITHEDTVEVTITAYGVSIQGNTAMFPGSQTVLNATIMNEGQAVAGNVNWTVEGNGTITASGNQVVVQAKGKAGTIKVTASWTSPAGTPCSATHEIAVNAYTVHISTAATAVSKGSQLPLSVVVKKNGEVVSNPSVSWSIVNLTSGDVTTKTGTSLNLTVNEDVGTVLVITASAQFGGMTVTDSCTIKVTDYKLTISPASVNVDQGETTELKASLTKGGNAVSNPVITWNVTKADGSALSVSGSVLNLLADQPVGTELTVVASAVVDGETILSDTAKVKIVAPVVYKITLNKTSASLKQGESTTFSATVTKDGSAVSSPALTWTLSGATKAGTAIDQTGKLTIDEAEPIGTKLTVTVKYSESGKTVSAEALVTIINAPKQDAYTQVTDGYQTPPSNAVFLADDGVTWVESVNLNGAQAIRNGAWQNGAAIYIGGTATTGGTNFKKGIGVQPQSPTATNDRGASWTTIDISSYGADTFYSAIGGTNASNQQNGHNSFIYQVYGATEKNGPFTLLAESSPITKTTTGEFKVDIKGVKYLKLVIKCTDTGTHGYGNSVWANACVYDSTVENYVVTATAAATTVQQGKTVDFTAKVTKDGQTVTGETVKWAVTGATKSGTKIDQNGKLTVDKAEPVGTKLNVTASIVKGETTYTSDVVVITVEEAKSELFQADGFTAFAGGKYQKLAKNVIWLSDVKWVESVNLDKKEAIRNGVWQNGAAIYIGGKSGGEITDGTKFDKGIGVQPQAPTATNNRGASWTTINVANLKCDTFYAAVGSTNLLNQNEGQNSFIYQVFGNTEKGGEFFLLAESAPLTKTETGEFKLNIKGIYELKLLIKCTETGSHACGNSVWANACVYNKDGSNGNLSAMSGYTATETPKQKKAYTSVKDGKYLTPTGQITFLSDIDWIESVNLDKKEAIRNGAWQNGAAIWIGGKSLETGGTRFMKGLGVQPQAPTADNNRGASWTTFDLTGLSADTFYAVIGGTNPSNQENGHNSFIYQVYGATKENGKYTLLAQSEPITKTQTGEFKVDITGYTFLKLQIKCAETGNHGYGNSVWANACVFNSKTGNLVEGEIEVDVTQPTVPTVVKPRPTVPAETTDPDVSGENGNMMILAIAAAVALLAVVAVVVIVAVTKKKKRG